MKRPGQPMSSYRSEARQGSGGAGCCGRNARKHRAPAFAFVISLDRADASSGFAPCGHGVVRGRDIGVDIAPVALTKDRVAQMRGQVRLGEAGIARLVDDGRAGAKGRERRHQLKHPRVGQGPSAEKRCISTQRWTARSVRKKGNRRSAMGSSPAMRCAVRRTTDTICSCGCADCLGI